MERTLKTEKNHQLAYGAALLCAVVLSLIVLYGWIKNDMALKSLLPGRPDMKANAAVCFLLTSLAIWAARSKPFQRSWEAAITYFCSVFVLIFSILVLLEYLFPVNFGIDELLFIDPNGIHGHSPPGRFSPVTAVNFILLTAGLLLDTLPDRPWYRLSQTFFLFSFLVSFQSFLGNAFGLSDIFGMGLFIPMAVHTALSFTLLSACFLASRSRFGFMKRFTADTPSSLMARRMIVAVILVPPLIRGLSGYGASRGLYTTDFSTFLQVSGGLVFMSVIVTWTAGALYRVELERERLRQREILAYKEAEAASLAKSQFLANMSHEIRTPLGVILGFSELALESLDRPEEARSYLTTIRRNSESLAKLIGEILDLSKVEAKKMDFEKIRFPLKPMIDEIQASFEMQTKGKGISLNVITEKGIPAQIESDPTRLRQILVNLIGNAVKFTEFGSVELRLTALPPEKDSSDRKIAFQVTDTGIGISDEQKTHLFQAFSQADSSMSRRFGGTGLGLLLSKELAQALGGDLVLERSAPGKGSVFVATVSAGEWSEADLAPSPVAQSEQLPHFQGFRILVVEDSLDNQVLITRYLRTTGAQVKIVDNGRSALQSLATESFDVVLMDIQMPVMDGFQTVQVLRAEGYRKPVLALTAHAVREEREKAMRMGFNDYLTKPINRKILIETLRKFQPPSPQDQEDRI